MKYSPYSFSKINTHISCPKKFEHVYIKKTPQGPCDMTALFKGAALHSLLEHHPNCSNHKLAEKYKYIYEEFIKSELGEKYLSYPSIREFSFGLTKKLEPCQYKDKEALFRGSVDYICNIDNELYLCDWKSGKYKETIYQDYNQLMFYAIYFFIKYEHVDIINISYIYIEHNLENKMKLERKYFNNYVKTLIDSIKNIENDIVYNKNITKVCSYCPFEEHCKI